MNEQTPHAEEQNDWIKEKADKILVINALIYMLLLACSYALLGILNSTNFSVSSFYFLYSVGLAGTILFMRLRAVRKAARLYSTKDTFVKFLRCTRYYIILDSSWMLLVIFCSIPVLGNFKVIPIAWLLTSVGVFHAYHELRKMNEEVKQWKLARLERARTKNVI